MVRSKFFFVLFLALKSSAKMYRQRGDVMLSNRELMYRLKRPGDSIPPYGAPLFILITGDVLLVDTCVDAFKV